MKNSILPQEWNVPQQLRLRLGSLVGSQKSIEADGHLILALHAPPKPDERHRVGRFFWRDPEGVWRSSSMGDGVESLTRHLEEYDKAVETLEIAEAKALTASEYFDVFEKLTPIYRAAQHLYQTLQAARDMCESCNEIVDLRDHAYTIDRSAELLFSETKNALDLLMAKRGDLQAQASHQMSVAAHRLNKLAAFFFPIITVASILGIDFEKSSELLFGLNFSNSEEKSLAVVYFGIGMVLCLAIGWMLTLWINRSSEAPGD